MKLDTEKRLTDMRWRGIQPRVVLQDRKGTPTADAEKN